MFKAKEMGYWK